MSKFQLIAILFCSPAFLNQAQAAEIVCAQVKISRVSIVDIAMCSRSPNRCWVEYKYQEKFRQVRFSSHGETKLRWSGPTKVIQLRPKNADGSASVPDGNIIVLDVDGVTCYCSKNTCTSNAPAPTPTPTRVPDKESGKNRDASGSK